MTILFANFPWWVQELIKDQPGRALLRRGIRAGSRWPFTMPSAYRPDNFQFGSYLPTPFFLGSAAAYVADKFPDSTVQVVVRDSIARGESYESFFNYLLALKPTHLVIETGAASWAHDLKMLKDIKRLFSDVLMPDIRIAVAGPTVRSASATTPAGTVDAWLVGEYEKNALAFVRGASGVLDFAMLTRDEMNELPFPMYDEPAALNYWDGCPAGQKAPHLQVMASRGCNFRCSFCSWPATMTGEDPDGTKERTIRRHSVQWLEPFIRERMARAEAAGTPLKSCYFDDDYFNNGKKHVLEICEMMKRIGLPWGAMCRADTCDDETWIAMRDSGCFGVKAGFESASQRVVDQIVNKHLKIDVAVERCRFIKSLGMSVHTTWTTGLPGETEDEKKQTVELIERMYREGLHDTHQLSGTAVIEGTPLALIESGQFLKKYPGAKIDANYQSSHDGVSKLEGMKK